MKLDILETHDRLLHFSKQKHDIPAFAQNIINSKPFGDVPFYLFGHTRTLPQDERESLWITGKFRNIEEVPDKKILWQPRLTKPSPQENSMLFKAYPNTDNIKAIWIIPRREIWNQFAMDKMCENKVVAESIYLFLYNKKKLEQPDPDDLSEEAIHSIYKEIASRKKTPKPTT